MKLSFILLSYNQCEKVLNCIDSIILSGIPDNDYEIIVVDDGSSDNTVENIKSQYNRVILYFTSHNRVNTRNKSLGRNIGIKMAKGEYIRFVDGDDYFDSYMLYLEYKHIDDTTLYLTSTYHLQFHRNIYTYSIPIDIRKLDEYTYYDFGICSFIVKKDFLIENNIFFIEEKYCYDLEDFIFYHLLLDAIGTESMIGLIYYKTYMHIITSNSCCNNRSFFEHIKNITEIGNYINDVISSDKIKKMCSDKIKDEIEFLLEHYD